MHNNNVQTEDVENDKMSICITTCKEMDFVCSRFKIFMIFASIFVMPYNDKLGNGSDKIKKIEGLLYHETCMDLLK